MLYPKRLTRVAFTTLANAMLTMSLVQAQQQTAQEEVIVYGTTGLADSFTGSRLDLSVLETPATIDVIDGDAIRDRIDLSVNEAVTRSAGFTTEADPGNGHSSIVARGFAGSNAVTKLYDGNQVFSISMVATLPQDTWSLDRIEVLKGPSSVLYGQGGIGGAINLVPRMPEFEPSSEIRLLTGENDTTFVGLDFTGGLSDTVAYRVDISKETSDGWVNNGDSENEHLSLALLWQASDDLSLTARYDSGNSSPMAYFGSLVKNGAFIEQFAFLNLNVTDSVNRYEDESLRLKADWNISDATNLSAEVYQMNSDRWWRNAEYYQYFEDEGGVLRTDPLILGHDVEQSGIRASFTFEPTPTVRALVGLEVNDLSFARPTNWGPGNPEPISWWGFQSSIADSTGDFDVVDPLSFQPGNLSNITDALTTLNQDLSDVDQTALFAELQYKLTDQLALVGALRYENLDSHYERALGKFSRDWNEDSISGRLGFVFDVSSNTAIYSQYSTGVEHPSGTVVTFGGEYVESELVESEQLEIGIKSSIAGTGLQWSLALFDITKNNLLIDDPNSGNPDDVIVIDEQTSAGIEAGLNYALTDRLQVHANLAALNAETNTGERPQSVPEMTWNAGFAWSATDRTRLVADARFVDDRSIGKTVMPSYTVFDASLHFRVTDSLDAFIKGENLNDELYAFGSYWSGTWLVGKPRTFSVGADLRF